ncbi:MAG: hypothetical protein ABSH38_04955 [Verrucomicrobiota bacterium]|jgi:20S proteasome alpha/beta subunit
MTIVVGLIGKESIVLASDSQSTYGVAKLLNARKIGVVAFENGTALVAQAGAAYPASRAVQLFERKAKSLRVTDSESFIKAARDSVLEVKHCLIEGQGGAAFSEDRREQFFRCDYYFKLMVAYYLNDQPFIFTIDSYDCLPVHLKSDYVAMGCGDTLAYYLLSEIVELGMPFTNCMARAIYVVEKVKQNVEGCGGSTCVGVVHNVPDSDDDYTAKVRRSKGLTLPYSSARVLDQNRISDIARRLTDVDFKCRKDRNKQIIAMIQGVEADYQNEWDESPEEVQ